MTAPGITPGDWTIEPGDTYPIRILKGPQFGALEVCRIGGCGTCPPSTDENRANAKAIRALPQLLKASRAILRCLDNLTTREFQISGDAPAREALAEALKEAGA